MGGFPAARGGADAWLIPTRGHGVLQTSPHGQALDLESILLPDLKRATERFVCRGGRWPERGLAPRLGQLDVGPQSAPSLATISHEIDVARVDPRCASVARPRDLRTVSDGSRDPPDPSAHRPSVVEKLVDEVPRAVDQLASPGQVIEMSVRNIVCPLAGPGIEGP